MAQQRIFEIQANQMTCHWCDDIPSNLDGDTDDTPAAGGAMEQL
jgi:hypothetical protein